MADDATMTRGLRVLVVDDDRDTADSLGIFLRHAGHDVRVAYGCDGALAEVRLATPDTIILDIGLPECSGYDLARRMRREPGLERVLLVALSGYGDEAACARSTEAGFDHHLVKPVDAESLLELLATGRAPSDRLGPRRVDPVRADRDRAGGEG